MTNRYGHRALRKGRVSLPGQLYLLSTTTSRRMPWFRVQDIAWPTCRLMIDPAVWGDARRLCWVLMPDHRHGLIQLGEHDSLPVGRDQIKPISTKTLGKLKGLHPLWERGFHDHALRRAENVAAVARYIVANPGRAGLCRALD